MRVAIIDDEKGILLAMGLYLELEGHTPLTFSSPKKALRALREDRVDLIILDMRMPEMNGEEVALHLKQDIRTKNIPLILFSAHESLPAMAARVGAEGFLEKPFQFEKLKSLIYGLTS